MATRFLVLSRNAPGFQRVINTRALFLQDQVGTMYINAAGFWYEARAVAGPWLVLASPPAALMSAAQAASAATAPDPLLPADGKPAQSAPALLVATQPTELVLTSGQPQIAPVDGTSLLTMTNADHAVFIVAATNDYYVLVSGRWFKASNMNGPWTYVPGNALPPDFARISVHDPKANVLVSVPGTPQAKEAAIAASIPQTATVSRSKASLAVSYAGAPKFEPIQGTGLTYAVNTPTPVIETGRERYYAVSEGVWFVANTPLGPWRVADAVPEAIYTIPATSPLHYVTYVRVYSSTPEEVVVGYTPGYMGLAVDPAGVVVYGTGYYYPPYIGGGYWYGYPATYGYGAGFAAERGGRVRLRLCDRTHLGRGIALLGAVLGLPGRLRELAARQHQSGQRLRPLGRRHDHPCLRLELVERRALERHARIGLRSLWRQPLSR